MLPLSLSAALTATEDVQHSACPIGCCNVVLTVTYVSVLLTLPRAPLYTVLQRCPHCDIPLCPTDSSTCLIRCCSVVLTVTYLSVLLTLLRASLGVAVLSSLWHTSLSYWLSSTCLIRCCSVVLTVTYLSVLLTLPRAPYGVAALSSLWHTTLSTDSLPHASLGVAALSSLWHTSLSFWLSSACSRHQTQGHEINVDHYSEVFTE